ncbi:MAG: hypothetical protein HWN66_02590 [Candidatus Helarchaeota archaeon]|nr:hypothetical protein [Candidatus Helarchaeota archaeon]
MNSKKITLILLPISIGLLIFLIVELLLISPQSLNINSGWKTENVLIDGAFTNDSEWDDASITQINSDAILYLKNDASNLYIFLDVIGDTGGSDNRFRIQFDTGNDEIWTPGNESAFSYSDGLFEGGTHYVENTTGIPGDYIIHCPFNCHSNLTGDANFSTSPNSIQNHQIYEIQIPLSLIGVNKGDQIGFFLYGGPFDLSFEYHYPSVADQFDMNTWAQLILAPTQAKGIIDFFVLSDTSWHFVLFFIVAISIAGVLVISKQYIFVDTQSKRIEPYTFLPEKFIHLSIKEKLQQAIEHNISIEEFEKLDSPDLMHLLGSEIGVISPEIKKQLLQLPISEGEKDEILQELVRLPIELQEKLLTQLEKSILTNNRGFD